MRIIDQFVEMSLLNAVFVVVVCLLIDCLHCASPACTAGGRVPSLSAAVAPSSCGSLLIPSGLAGRCISDISVMINHPNLNLACRVDALC